MKKLIYISIFSFLLASCGKESRLIPGVNPFTDNTTNSSFSGGSSSDDSGITDPDKDDDHDVSVGSTNGTTTIVIGGSITDPDKDDDHDVSVGSTLANSNAN